MGWICTETSYQLYTEQYPYADKKISIARITQFFKPMYTLGLAEKSTKNGQTIVAFLFHDNTPAHWSFLVKNVLGEKNVTTLE
jgi:hypothetical protein